MIDDEILTVLKRDKNCSIKKILLIKKNILLN